MTDTALFHNVWDSLNSAARISKEQTVWATHAWLQSTEAGQPFVALMQEDARRDSLFWAETATPAELECYMLAAATRLAENGSHFHGKHIKRLIAALFKKMSPTEQDAFLRWAGGNKSGGKDE